MMATRPKKARSSGEGPYDRQQDPGQPMDQNMSESPKHERAAKSDGSSSFLRAARAGNLEKVLDLLKNGRADIGTCNANGLNALHLAAKEGHLNIVTELIARGADVDASTKKGNTAMHIASLAGQLDVVKVLLQNGAKINAQSQTGFTPLYMAAQENHLAVVKYLLDKNANATLATEDGFTPMAVALQQGHQEVVNVLMEYSQRGRVRLSALHVAAKKDDVRAAALLLQNDQNAGNASKSGGIVNETTKSDFTPLHIAAHYGNSNVATLLVEKGANVNFKAKNAITPLHVSSKWGRKNVVQLLLDNNANVECKTRDGLTPLHCAARSGHDLVVDLLLERGAPVSAKTRNGLTALHMAAQGDHVDCARILIFHRAPVDDVTVDYLTPLHVAAHCGNVAVAKLLLDRKCQVDARALNGFTPLHIACKKNRIKVIELLLQYGALITSTTESGLTPLHVASFMGHIDIVVFLLQNGSDPNAPTVRGETSLHLATRGNQTDVMKLLLRNGAQVDAKAKEQQTPLHVASRLGAVDCVLLLLDHGATVDAPTVEHYTPLHIATKEGHEEVVQVLLDRGANHGLATSKGFTPLHIAAKYGTVRVARVLLKKGADPNVAGKNGLTPLHVAAHYNHLPMVTVLLENRANPHATAKNGYTPLHIAAKKDEIDIATALLDAGAKANAESKNGFTALHLATQEGHTDMVSLLLERKARVNGQAKNGLTAMHLAAQEDHVPVAEILVKYKSNIDPQTKAGYTPLHTACHFGQLNMIRFLLDHGASVTTTTKLGYTPLHQAAQQGHVLVINLLLRYNADPNALTTTGQSPLSIAEQLGYISVIEILKQVTQVVVTTSVTDKYKLLSPEVMQEAAMSDEEDEGEEIHLADQSYQYLTTGDDMKGLQDDGASHHKDQDLFGFDHTSGRRSAASSVMGHGQIQDDLRYTTEPDETILDSTLMRELQYSTLQQQHLQLPANYGQTSSGVSSGQQSPTSPDERSPKLIENIEKFDEHDMDVDGPMPGRAWDDHLKQYEDTSIPHDQLTSTLEQRTQATRYGPSISAKPTVLDVGTPRVNGVDIVVTKDEVPVAQEAQTLMYLGTTPMSETIPTPTDFQNVYKSNMSETDSRMYGSSSAMSYASSFDPDNVALRHPVYSGFLVSFLVDARGGAMRGCRHSGIRIIIPPLKLCQPTRITCKLVRRDKLPQPPPLLEGEALASRVLVMGPAGAKFTGPVILEVPHFASLHGHNREIMVLRSDNGQTWREHSELASEQSVQSMLCASFEDLESAEELYHRRITRIITSDFPKYFAIVTRIQQDSAVLGPEGGIMSSRVVPQVQAVFPPGALTKSIKVGLQAQPVSTELISKVLGTNVYVGPIVTIEPRRRKFHKPITVTLPLPVEMQSTNKQNTANLRLLCSITGGTDPTEWEDITSSPMTLANNCVSFPSSVSARFWLIYCPTPSDSVPMATRLYTEAIIVPFMANFVVFAKRRNETDAQLRLFCMTDDKIDKTLECQEHFKEVSRSRDIEVWDGKRQYIEMAGNLVTVVKAADVTKPDTNEEGEKQLYINFRAFRENRRHVNVRVWDTTRDPVGTAIFLSESPRVRRDQIPLCTLTVNLGDVEDGPRHPDGDDNVSADTADLCRKLAALQKVEVSDDDQISKAQLRLTDIAEHLEGDWVILAKQLGISREEIMKIQSEYQYVVEQALVMLHLWVEKNKAGASGNALERALKYIRREDIIHKCIHVVEEVTDDQEKLAARAQLISSDDTPHPTDAVLSSSSIEDNIVPVEDPRKKVSEAAHVEPVASDTDHEDAILLLAKQLESFTGDDSELAVPVVSDSVAAAPTVTEDELVASIRRRSTNEDRNAEDLDLSSAETSKRQQQTFEEWASQTEPSVKEPSPCQTPVSVVSVSALPPQPSYLETAFEDWVEQQEMGGGDGVPKTPPPSNVESVDENNFAEGAEVYRETVEGEPELRVELDDGEEVLDDGTTLRHQTVTRRRICPVSEVLVVGGVATECKTTDRLIDIEIEEDILVLPPGVGNPDESDNLRTVTDVKEMEEQLSDGTPVRRKIITTTVLPSAELLTEQFRSQELSEIEQCAEQMVSRSIDAALHEVQMASEPPPPEGADENDGEQDTTMLRVYTDTLEGEPEVETDVQESEETLPDGTVIKRRITKTKQKQTIIKRVVMEGPEDELPSNEEEAQQFLQQTDLNDDDVIHRYGDHDVAEITEEPDTNVQEYEETLPDGTVVKRRIVTTTQQQLTTERVVLEGDSAEPFDSSYDDHHVFEAETVQPEMAISAAGDDGTDDEDDTTRVVMTKEIRKQRILRDGKEETVITEDVHVMQEDEAPAELDAAMQTVVDQFMGRSHSGQSSV